MRATIRSLAVECRVSTATVSRALAGGPGVLPATRAAVEAAAQRAGYRRNRVVGTLMAHVRRGRAEAFVGNMAVVHVPAPGQSSPGPQQRRIIDAAQQRAAQLGYRAYEFSLASKGMRIPAVVRMLRARGVVGLIFLYTQPLDDLLPFPWQDFVVVELDYGRPVPRFHTICHDHHLSMTMALNRLKSLGYERIGLFIERFKDERTGFKWSGAFRTYQVNHGGIGKVPVHTADKITEGGFVRWFTRVRPDVVVGHSDAAVSWLGKRGLRIPQDVGFLSLNWLSRSLPCAGIDPRLEEQGAVAVESLVGLLQRDESGLPLVPRTLLVPGRIVDGPSLRESGGDRGPRQRPADRPRG